MLRDARTSLAFGLALAACGFAALPADAQGTVREHRGHGASPAPAPTPTIDRDQRRGVRPDDPIQWEVRGDLPRPCLSMMISNLAREGLERPSMLTPTASGLGWSADGGNWQVLAQGYSLGGQSCPHADSQPQVLHAIYSQRAGKFLDAGQKWTRATALVWNFVKKRTVFRDGVKYSRFAIFNTVEKRFLMLCHGEPERARNHDALCLYNPTRDMNPR